MTDRVIIILYLAVTLAAGLLSSRIRRVYDKPKKSEGSRLFVLVAVLTSGFIGGGYSVGNAAGSHENGIIYSLALCGFSLGLIFFTLTSFRKIHLSGAKTAGEAAGNAYGDTARRVTGLLSFIFCAGVLAAQLSTVGIVLSGFFGISRTTATLLTAAVIAVYSTVGGLNAVVGADTLQFIVLSFGLPLLALFSISSAMKSPEVFISFLYPQSGLTPALFLPLCFSFAVGELITPQLVQRFSLTDSKKRFSVAMIISAALSALFFIMTGFVGVSAHLITPDSASSDALVAAALAVMPDGLLGAVGASLCAVLMSSADSALNTAAVSVTHDLFYGLSDGKNGVALRVVNVAACLFAVSAALFVPDVMSLLMLSYKLWTPLTFSQLLFALKGKKGSTAMFIIPAAAGISGVLLWDVIFNSPLGAPSVPAGFVCNSVAFILIRLYEKKSRLPKGRRNVR